MRRSASFSLCLALLTGILTGCQREHSIVRQASWTCVSQHYPSTDANIQTVEFRYQANPREFDIVPGLFLCEELQGSGNAVVDLRFIQGPTTFGFGSGGRRLSTIDGREYQAVAGWGHHGFGPDQERHH